MIKFELLAGASAFWARAADDIAASARRVLVQAMSFEGDTAGRAVALALTRCRARDRRVLVDDYTRLNINDQSVRSWSGRLNRAVRDEVAETARMFRDLVSAGVPVRVTNPAGRFGAGYPARNHKKLIVADDVAYIGGINFCDHNYAWDDFMVRLEGRPAADFLADDFDATFSSRARSAATTLGAVTLISLDGRANWRGLEPVYDAVSNARRAITVLSPYLTFPFTDHLRRAVKRGVDVRLITPWDNNKAIVRNALLRAAARAGFETVLLPRMSHLKAILVDEEILIVGSSNFDFVSLAAEEEVIAIVTDPSLIAEFQRRIIVPAIAEALPAQGHDVSRRAGFAASLALRIADPLARAARTWPRAAVDWSD